MGLTSASDITMIVGVDPAALQAAASGLRQTAAGIRSDGQHVNGAWKGLAAFYHAPEAGQLLAGMAPLQTQTDQFAAQAEEAAAALDEFATTVAPLKTQLDSLATQAQTMLDQQGNDPHWHSHQANVNAENHLIGQVNAAQAAYWAAEIRCANRINALDGGPRYAAGSPTDPKAVPAGMTPYGLTSISTGTPTPWGTPGQRTPTWWEGSLHILWHATKGFVVDGLWGTAKGIFGLVNPFDWKTFSGSWNTIWDLGQGIDPWTYLAGGHQAHDSKTAWANFGKGFIAYDEWGKDPSRAAGVVLFNVGTLGIAELKVGKLGKVGDLGATGRAVSLLGKASDPFNVARLGVKTSFHLGGRTADLFKSRAVDLNRLDDLTRQIHDHYGAQAPRKTLVPVRDLVKRLGQPLEHRFAQIDDTSGTRTGGHPSGGTAAGHEPPGSGGGGTDKNPPHTSPSTPAPRRPSAGTGSGIEPLLVQAGKHHISAPKLSGEVVTHPPRDMGPAIVNEHTDHPQGESGSNSGHHHGSEHDGTSSPPDHGSPQGSSALGGGGRTPRSGSSGPPHFGTGEHSVPLNPEGNKVLGGRILAGVKNLYEPYREPIAQMNKRMAVIRFEPRHDAPTDWARKMEASRISAVQKVKSFNFLGFETDHIVFPANVSYKQFADTIARINEDAHTAGAIVQFPPPPHLRAFVDHLAPSKDVDALLGSRSNQVTSATADGIARIVNAHAHGSPLVAVVGARGFVGQGVVHLLGQKGLEIIPLDLGDDLRQVRHANIVVSVAGSPHILGPEHLLPTHQLVVDSGFVPQEPGVFFGDVNSTAYEIPARITPVPGGTGPVEMAVLLERMIRTVVDPNLPSWKITP
ncbi:MAG: hypothetical protein JWN52_4477 [Actinomycetia bacterium]|nr:hypothetical protein [Actinomycetes bacterium]